MRTRDGKMHLTDATVKNLPTPASGNRIAYAIRWKLRADNPVKGIERNQETKRRRYLSANELTRLTAALAALHDQQAANVVRFLLLTGARRGEVLSARWDQIDLKAGNWNKHATGTKQKLDHSVPLSDAALQLLTELYGDAEDEAVFVFPARSREGHRTEVKDAWEALCKAASIEGARLHDLRHTMPACWQAPASRCRSSGRC